MRVTRSPSPATLNAARWRVEIIRVHWWRWATRHQCDKSRDDLMNYIGLLLGIIDGLEGWAMLDEVIRKDEK